MTRLLTLILCSSIIVAVSASNLPSPAVPDGLGANIHFLGEPARDLNMLQAGGFRFVRMDISWSTVEKEKNVYDFSEHDKLIEGLSKRGMRALLILCYSNTLYETNFMSVRTEAGRQAFARFSKAAAQRYKGKNVIWEIWNEPNIMFWRPQPSIDDYMALVKAVVPAIREADPKAVCIGPATSAVDMIYLEACFKRGLLKYIDAVSVHPYRSSIPETVTPEILALKTLIARYSPDRPNIPIISGEWGYTTVWPHTNTYSGVDNKLQGEYLPRQMLTNLSLGIPMTIWYDWHDGGVDPMEREFHFGTVDFEYNPKPSYINMKKMIELLSGKQFVKRLPTDLDDYLLIFSDGKRHTIAAWTIAKPHTINPSARMRIDLTNEPQYLDIHANDREMLAQSIFTVTCKSHGIRSGVSSKHRFAPQFTVHVSNPFAKSIRVELKPVMSEIITGNYVGATSFMLEPDEEKTVLWRGNIHRRDKTELSINLNASIDGIRCSQDIQFGLINPISFDMQLQRDKTLAVVIHNPGLSKLRAKIQIESNNKVVLSKMVDISGNQTELPIGMQYATTDNTWRITLQSNKDLIADSGDLKITPLDVTADNTVAVVEGDLSIPSSCMLTEGDGKILNIAYAYSSNFIYSRISPRKDVDIKGKPHAAGVWVRGDGSGLKLRMRFIDAKGRLFQPIFGIIDFKGWRFLTVDLDDPSIENWGQETLPPGITYPIKLNTYILLDGIYSPVKSSIDITGYCLIYHGSDASEHTNAPVRKDR